MLNKLNIQAKILGFVGSMVVATVLILTIFNTVSSTKKTIELSTKLMRETAYSRAEEVYIEFSSISTRVSGFARAIISLVEGGVVNQNIYTTMIEGYAKQVNKNIVVGIGFGLEAGVISPEPFSVYKAYSSKGEILPTTTLGSMVNENYYKEPIKTKEDYLSTVYDFKLDNGDIVKMITYGFPIVANGKAVGTIFVDLYVDIMQEKTKAVDIFGVRQAILISDDGNIVGFAPPSGISDSEVRSKYIGNSTKSAGLFLDMPGLTSKIENGENDTFERKNSLSGIVSLYELVTIKMSSNRNWGLILQAPKKVITKDADTARNISILVSSVLLIVLIIIMLSLIKSIIVAPIKYAVEEVEHISKGDLTKESNANYLKRVDEIGTLIQAFDKMKKDISAIVSNINSAASEISSAASEVSQGNEDLSHRTESQAASLEETASSMEEMASTIKSSAEHSLEGNKMMIESKEAVAGAGTIIDSTTKSIEEVLEASTKISDITKMIESIALQTNILALNAAVEAARAGEQGRGFAVVASEVRNLAQTTQTSVKDITTLIVDVNDKIKKATDSAHESKVIFDDIQKKITHTAEIMQDISSTAVEQQSGVDQINKAVTDMDIVTQQNAALVEESSAAAESLSAQAKDLVDVISFFKVAGSKPTNNTSSPKHTSSKSSHNDTVNKLKKMEEYPKTHSTTNNVMKPKTVGSEFGTTISKANISKDEYESF